MARFQTQITVFNCIVADKPSKASYNTLHLIHSSQCIPSSNEESFVLIMYILCPSIEEETCPAILPPPLPVGDPTQQAVPLFSIVGAPSTYRLNVASSVGCLLLAYQLVCKLWD